MNRDEAAELHEELYTLDTHIDTPTGSLQRPGWDFAVRHDPAVDHSQCDLPRMVEGGVDALVFAMFVGQGSRDARGHAQARELAMGYLARTHEVIASNSAHCGIALAADDGLRLKTERKRAIYLSLENAYSIGRDLEALATFHARGVRMIGLTHMLNNEVADSSTDPRGAEWNGLSAFGRELVQECNRLGIVLDASHASDQALADLLEESRAPVVLSHSSCRAVCDHPRNVGDELLGELARRGGVLQMNALAISLVNAPGNRRTEATAEMLLRFKDQPLMPDVMQAIDREYMSVAAQHPNPRVTLDDFVRHVEHAVEVMGVEHIGIGCDLDGGGGDFEGIHDVSDYPNITWALVQRGWTQPALAQLWSENTLRVFRAVEKFTI